MPSALKAGLVYFAVVFAVGFLLGAVRAVALAPRLGETLAVAIELPVILSVSWVACRRVIARFSVPGSLAPRFAMGGLAFGLLVVAKVTLSVLGLGRTIVEHLEVYRTAPGLVGLSGQLAYALFPAVQLRVRTR